MAVAIFDYAAWQALFPELAAVPSATAAAFFNVVGAGLISNTDSSVIADSAARLTIMNYAVAHLAKLAGYPLAAGQTTPTPDGSVGRVSSASEGAVSASLDYGQVSASAAWWVQTQYGATAWQMLLPFRTMRYSARPPYYFGPAYMNAARPW